MQPLHAGVVCCAVAKHLCLWFIPCNTSAGSSANRSWAAPAILILEAISAAARRGPIRLLSECRSGWGEHQEIVDVTGYGNHRQIARGEGKRAVLGQLARQNRVLNSACTAATSWSGVSSIGRFDIVALELANEDFAHRGIGVHRPACRSEACERRPRAAFRWVIYNLAELNSYSELEWVQRIGQVVNWQGRVVPVSKELMPQHLRVPYNSEQHWVVSSARIREELGFAEPIDENTGLKRTITWERANPPSANPAHFD